MGQTRDEAKTGHPESLLSHVRDAVSLQFDDLQENAWVEVIQKMDEVYSDLIRYEVDLEEKNTALEDAQLFISSVLSSMSDVLIVCDLKSCIQQVNNPTMDLTGYSSSQLAGRPMSDLFVDKDDDTVKHMCSLIEGGEDVRDCEVRLKTASNGQTDVISLNCSVRYDHNGKPAGAVLIGRPVGELRRAYEALNKAHAELKQAQTQLVQQEKMASLGRLVAGVAHELNNPISFICGNVHTLEKYSTRLSEYLAAVHAGATPDELAEKRQLLRIDNIVNDLSSLIDGTLEGADRVTDIVKNLRRLSYAQTRDPEPIDLSKMIETAVRWTAKGAKPTIAIDVDVPKDLMILGHAGPFHQVLVNLVQNALDAVRDAANGKVSVRARREDNTIQIQVEDSGPGISTENLSKVFDPFFTTKPVGEGTGLGLWISYGIIREQGGTLAVENVPDSGARFTMTLPA